MDDNPTIQVMQPDQVDAAKRVICTVVHEIFCAPPTPEQVDRLIATYEAKNEFSDITDFQNHYLNNNGLFLVLVDDEKVVGTGAIRRLDSDNAELKRMWFLPPYRSRCLGYQMAQQLLAFARSTGYKNVRLDTDQKQQQAIRLYRRLGFLPIPRYNDSVCDYFMELQL